MNTYKICFYSMFNRGEFHMERPYFEPFNTEVVIIDEKSEDDFVSQLEDIDILIVANNVITPEHIRMMKKCKIIARQGVGVDNIATKEAAAAGIAVCNVPGGSVDEVSDHSIALFLSLARNIPFYSQHIKVNQIWDHQSMPPMKRFNEMQLFLIGFGQIGQLVAKKAEALFGEITIYDPCISHDQAKQLGVKKIDNIEVGLKTADIVSLHLPFKEELTHIINSKTLKCMKPEAFLVNMARGAHVDTDALNEALDQDVIAGAALDVIENELKTEKGDFSHPIYKNPKVIFTPHVGWYGINSRKKARIVAADAVVDFMQGKTPRNQVN